MNNVQYIRCRYCDNYIKQKKMIFHKCKHHNFRYYIKCDENLYRNFIRTFTRKLSIDEINILSNFYIPEQIYPCIKCNFISSTKYKLTIHKDLYHTKITCKKCKKNDYKINFIPSCSYCELGYKVFKNKCKYIDIIILTHEYTKSINISINDYRIY